MPVQLNFITYLLHSITRFKVTLYATNTGQEWYFFCLLFIMYKCNVLPTFVFLIPYNFSRLNTFRSRASGGRLRVP